MAKQTQWFYEHNDGSHRPYDSNVSQWLNDANIGDQTTFTIYGNKYQIYKKSKEDCSQTNVRTQFTRKGISQIKYDKLNNQMDIDHDDTNTTSQWLWKDNDGSYKQFKGLWSNVPSELDKLNIGESYTMSNNKYRFEKKSLTKCVQVNTQTNYQRDVIIQQFVDSDNNNNGYEWYWEDNKGRLHAYSDDISKEIENLKVEESYFVHINNSQYQITKIAKDKCQQNNVNTNASRDVVRKSGSQSVPKSNKSRRNSYQRPQRGRTDDMKQFCIYFDPSLTNALLQITHL